MAEWRKESFVRLLFARLNESPRARVGKSRSTNVWNSLNMFEVDNSARESMRVHESWRWNEILIKCHRLSYSFTSALQHSVNHFWNSCTSKNNQNQRNRKTDVMKLVWHWINDKTTAASSPIYSCGGCSTAVKYAVTDRPTTLSTQPHQVGPVHAGWVTCHRSFGARADCRCTARDNYRKKAQRNTLRSKL